mmetsp:Transcript_32715/g.82520  ORF Transcript_32715/g.82520 Transcript_32715/m.82520 type:complete len:89 (-) Transcript_32715:648-914(-)
MVDCGKTMRDAALRHLAGHGVRAIDALLLTHAHADAILGLDDVRDFTEQHGGPLPWDVRPLPVYLNQTLLMSITHFHITCQPYFQVCC